MMIALLPEIREEIVKYCFCCDLKNLACTSAEYNKILQDYLFHTVRIPRPEENGQIPDKINLLRCSKALHFNGGVISEKVFMSLCELSNLHELNLIGIETPFENRIETLCNKLYMLKALRLSCSDIGDDHLTNLQNLHMLEELELCFSKGLTDLGLKSIASMSMLKMLNISYCCNITDSGIAVLQSLTSLKALNVSGCILKDQGLFAISTLKTVECLHLSYCRNITDIGLLYISKLPKLQKLYLCMCGNITDNGLAHLQNIPKLKQLDISDSGYAISDQGISSLSKIITVEKLNINRCYGITDESLLHISKLSALRELKLASCLISEESLAHLLKLQYLKVLNISRIKISDVGVSILKKKLELETLTLKETSQFE